MAQKKIAAWHDILCHTHAHTFSIMACKCWNLFSSNFLILAPFKKNPYKSFEKPLENSCACVAWLMSITFACVHHLSLYPVPLIACWWTMFTKTLNTELAVLTNIFTGRGIPLKAWSHSQPTEAWIPGVETETWRTTLQIYGQGHCQ